MGRKKILIAIDKFKGSLTSLQAANAIERGFERSAPGKYEFRSIEMADGGDGSLEVLQKRLQGAEAVNIKVHDPLGNMVDSQILLYGDKRGSAFIEMAKISGLEMVPKSKRNPLRTSTFGMGEAIKEAISRGASQITLSIGGSATNDGGAGMLQALGFGFYDGEGIEMAAPITGEDLLRVARVERPQSLMQNGAAGVDLRGVEFRVICDVTNPLLGEMGATAVYAPQKGAEGEALVLLESALANFAAVAERSLGVDAEYKEYAGAGAAGGLGYGGVALLGAELISGWRFFAQMTSLEESVKWADIVITGEGCIDSQTLSGKVVNGVLELAGKYDKRVVAFCGISKLKKEELGRIRCRSIAELGFPLEVCMSNAAKLLEDIASEEAQFWHKR